MPPLALASLRSHDRATSFILITHDAAATRTQNQGGAIPDHPFNVGAFYGAGVAASRPSDSKTRGSAT